MIAIETTSTKVQMRGCKQLKTTVQPSTMRKIGFSTLDITKLHSLIQMQPVEEF